MKIDVRSADSVVRKPDPRLRALLIYGPDGGLVGERSTTAASGICADLADPFRVVELTAQQLGDDPARLADEFAALSFGGGRRVVRVRSASEDIVPAVENMLAARVGDALIVIEAGELRPASPLRRLAETSELMAAISCYPDDERALDALLEEALVKAGLRVTPDARGWIIDNLGGDRGQTRSELEKLMLYKGAPKAGEQGTIEIDDALAILGDTAAIGLDEVVQSAFSGELDVLDRALDRVLAEGTSPIQILRALQRHGSQLHLAASEMAAGISAEAIAARQRPPLYGPRRSRFTRQLRQWDEMNVSTVLGWLVGAEVDCKSTGRPERTIVRRSCLQLAHFARRKGATA